MGKHGYYHLFSDGFRTDALFEDKQAFVSGMNIVAFCSIKCNITILAFCLMDNHVHFILYGTLEECMQFRDRFTHQYAIWYSNRYLKKRTEDLDFDIKVMEEEKYVLTSVAYVLRNSIAAGYAFCSEDYPWSSGGLYFRIPQKMEAMADRWKRISEIPARDRRRILQTHTVLPDDWKMTPEGFIWPGNYVGYRMVEKMFRTSRSFTYFMGRSNEEEINRSLNIHESISIPDTELREKAMIHCVKMFHTSNLRRLDAQSRIHLAKILRKEYRCSAKQIARIIHLDTKYIKEFI